MSVLIKSSQPCGSCGSNDAKAYYDDNEHCFSCGYHKNLNRTFTFYKVVTKFNGELPSESPMPDAYKNWFAVCNIKTIKSCYYSIDRGGLIIPMYDGRKTVGYQIRYIDREPKALTVGMKRPIYLSHESSRDVCIVEDIRSALKVNKYVNVLCLLGTSLSKEEFIALIEHDYNIYNIWLDGDAAGIQSSKKLFDKLRMCAIVNNIQTKKDPKNYSYTEIQNLLKLGDGHEQ